MAKFRNGNLWMGQNTETISENKALQITDKQQQYIDPGSADRSILLPAVSGSPGLSFHIIHIGTTNVINVKDSTGTVTIQTLNPGEVGFFPCNGTAWQSQVGRTGADGADGADGGTGGTGAQGAQGEFVVGEKGDTGAAGAKGDQGDQGLTGGIGGTGAQGDQGLTGDTGGIGGTGAQGEQGLTGAAGAQGDQGLTGAAGAQGDQGLTGATGSRGEGFLVDRHFIEFDENQITLVEAGTATPEDLYICTVLTDTRTDKQLPANIAGVMDKHALAFDGTDWYDYGPFLGETGATGAAGDLGAGGGTGGTGGTGDHGGVWTGDTGGTGAPGEAGVAGETGAAGAQGDQGLTGGTGAPGETGAAGGFNGSIKSQSTVIGSGVVSIAVTYAAAFADTNYAVLANLINTIDPNPAIYAQTIIAKTTTGFTVLLSGETDSANYVLDWTVVSHC